jgi:hypothetical protein
MRFQLYGFQLDIPKEYKIQIWKGSLYYEGTIEISDFENNLIKMDWNELNKIIETYESPNEFFKSHLNPIKEDKDVVEYNLQEIPWEEQIDHAFAFHKFTYKTERKFPKKEIHDFILGFGEFCHVTNRFVVIQYRPPSNKIDFEETAMKIIKSFKCKCDQTDE